MENAQLFRDVLLVAIAALLGGALAHALRLPTIVGFLVAGVTISPNTPGFVGNVEDIGHVADIGVILLMFGIGIEFSFRQMLAYRRLVLVGGGGQVLLTLVLGLVTGSVLGLGPEASLVLGFLAANTSTVVAVKVLEARGELRTVPGIAAINICIMQEMCAVLMVIVVPSLGGAAFQPADILLAVLKGVGLIGVAYALSVWVLPIAWRQVAHARSRELSLLAAIVLAVGLAAGSGLLGLSIAFGAFLAGLALSENEYGHATLSDVVPLRDVFASVFFLSMGMLIDPAVAWKSPVEVGSILLLFVGGKALIGALTTRTAGLNLRQALLTGLLLAQVGEFSFVIARTALDEGVISDTLGSAFLLAAGLSILLNPLATRMAPGLLGLSMRLPGLKHLLHEADDAQNPEEIAALRRHVIICGYGDTAGPLVRSLRGRDLPFVVIDNDPFVFERAKRLEPDLPFIYGDASRPETLELARIHEARAVAVTYFSPNEALVTAQNAIAANPRVDVVARGAQDDLPLLRRAGASEVVDPEFEASLEFVRHVLHRFGVDGREIVALQAQRRSDHYRAED